MDEIYIKIYASEDDEDLDLIREGGMLFDCIASSLFIDMDKVEEIDENNYLLEIEKIKNKFSRFKGNTKNDKS